MDAADELLMGGGGAPAARFPTVGTVVKGIVLEKRASQQTDMQTGKPKTFEDGNPMMQLIITIQTEDRDDSLDDDDGKRRVFAKGNMLTALRDAVREAKAATLNPGDELAIKYVGNGERKNKGFQPPKLYKARVTPGVKSTANDLLTADFDSGPAHDDDTPF